MTNDQALAFLRQHQPLPRDAELSNADLEQLQSVRRLLVSHPNAEALELLLGVFGDGSGFGVYQLLEDAVAAHHPSSVVPALAKKLKDGPRSVRYWCAVLAANYPDKRLIPALAAALAPDDFDLRYAAVTALGGNRERGIQGRPEGVASEGDRRGTERDDHPHRVVPMRLAKRHFWRAIEFGARVRMWRSLTREGADLRT